MILKETASIRNFRAAATKKPVLSVNCVGAGAGGIYTVGVLKRLSELRSTYPVDVVFGASSGILNATFWAQGDLDLLEHLWLNIKNEDVMALHLWRAGTTKACLYDNTPLLNTIRKYVTPLSVRNAIDTFATVMCVDDLTCRYIRLQDVIDPAIVMLASTAIPAVFPPQEITVKTETHMGVDGGTADDYNVISAMDSGVKKIILIHPNTTNPIKYKNILSSLSLLKELLVWNNYVKEMAEYKALKEAGVAVPELVEVIPLRTQTVDTVDFDMKGVDRPALIKCAYERAKEVLG